jgi:hypothetical protein
MCGAVLKMLECARDTGELADGLYRDGVAAILFGMVQVNMKTFTKV